MVVSLPASLQTPMVTGSPLSLTRASSRIVQTQGYMTHGEGDIIGVEPKNALLIFASPFL